MARNGRSLKGSALLAGGNATVGNLLLAWTKSFSNFAEEAELWGLFGWTDETADIPCAWDVITCFDDGTLRIWFENTLALNGADVALALLGSCCRGPLP